MVLRWVGADRLEREGGVRRFLGNKGMLRDTACRDRMQSIAWIECL